MAIPLYNTFIIVYELQFDICFRIFDCNISKLSLLDIVKKEIDICI